MSVLAIETATEQLGVALVEEHRVVASYELLAQHPHAVELPQAVTRVLDAGGATLEQVEGIVVDIGPGSFTGLRIGMAFVKAVIFRAKKPVVGISCLDVLAGNLPLTAHLVCPIVDAKQRKVYAALYRTIDGSVHKQSDYHLVTLDGLMPMLNHGPIVFLGDGVALYRERLTKQLGKRALFAAPELWLPRAATLGRLGLERLRRGEQDDPRSLVPMYLHPMDCSIQLKQPPAPSANSPSPVQG